MTGEKNRFKTHEQLWKLEDGDLSTPQHDELVFHLLNNKNIESLLDFLDIGMYDSLFWHDKPEQIKTNLINIAKGKLGDDEFINNNEMDKLLQTFDLLSNEHVKNVEKYVTGVLIYKEFKTKFFKIKSEVPIKNGTNFIIGYIDIQFTIKSCDVDILPSITTPHNVEFLKTIHDVDLMERIGSGSDPTHDEIVSYSDTLYGMIRTYLHIPKFSKYHEKLAWKNPNEDYKTINIEVKPKIKSFGETLRQINTYRDFDPHAFYIIYSPDSRFKEAFELQGISFVTPSDLGLK